MVTHAVFLVIKACLYCFAVSETTTSTTAVENALVRPGMREGVSGGTAGMGMTAMGMEQGAYLPLEVKVDVSGILGADKVLSKGAQEASSLLLLVRVMIFECRIILYLKRGSSKDVLGIKGVIKDYVSPKKGVIKDYVSSEKGGNQRLC